MNRTTLALTLGTVLLLSQPTSALAASTLRFSPASYRVFENNGDILLTVTRAGDVDTIVTVDYATANTTAIAGPDYTAASGTLNFAAGQTNQTVRIAILNDGLREATESFSVVLNNPSASAVLGSPNRATVTIDDNDPGIAFVPSSHTVAENAGTVVITVTRGNDVDMPPFTVDYTTSDGTATAGTN